MRVQVDHLDRCHNENSRLSSDIEENMKKLIVKDNTILKLREQLGRAKRMETTEKTGLRERCHQLEKENRELNKLLKDRRS
jgi:hypothetical protein